MADTIVDTTEETLAAGTANGFTFHEPSPHALSAALKRAAAYHARSDAWLRLIANGMKEDWSWTRSAKQYAALYEATVARVRQGATALACELRLRRSGNSQEFVATKRAATWGIQRCSRD